MGVVIPSTPFLFLGPILRLFFTVIYGYNTAIGVFGYSATFDIFSVNDSGGTLQGRQLNRRLAARTGVWEGVNSGNPIPKNIIVVLFEISKST